MCSRRRRPFPRRRECPRIRRPRTEARGRRRKVWPLLLTRSPRRRRPRPWLTPPSPVFAICGRVRKLRVQQKPCSTRPHRTCRKGFCPYGVRPDAGWAFAHHSRGADRRKVDPRPLRDRERSRGLGSHPPRRRSAFPFAALPTADTTRRDRSVQTFPRCFEGAPARVSGESGTLDPLLCTFYPRSTTGRRSVSRVFS